MKATVSTVVSVIIPCWGIYTKYLKNAIDSVREQATEIIVVGNQEAINIAEAEKVIAVKAPRPFALSTARKTGLEAATSPMVCLLDSDDTMLPGKLTAMTQALVRNNSAIAVTGCLSDTDGSIIWPSKLLAKLVANRFGGPFLLCKNVLVVNGACVAYRHAMLNAMVEEDYEDEDWHQAVKLRRQGKVVFMPEAMVMYNRREGSRSRQERQPEVVKKSHDELFRSAMAIPGRHEIIWQTIDTIARIPRAMTRQRALQSWNVTDIVGKQTSKT